MSDHNSGRKLQRAKLARLMGCNLETIRYYERHAARLRFILRARELGFSLREVRGLLDLVDGGTQTCAEVEERTMRHLADVRAKIADLMRIEEVLTATAAQCSGEDVPHCPVLEALAR